MREGWGPSQPPSNRILVSTLTFSFVSRYPYLNHLVLNAGSAPFAAIDWLKFIGLLLLHPIITLTIASYIIQRAGERSNDGFGYTWQCNVFGPYLFVRPFPQHPTLGTHRNPFTFAVSGTGTSTRSLPLPIRRRLPLPLSRVMDELTRSHAFLPAGRLAARRDQPSLRKFEIPNRPCRQSARETSSSVGRADEPTCQSPACDGSPRLCQYRDRR